MQSRGISWLFTLVVAPTLVVASGCTGPDQPGTDAAADAPAACTTNADCDDHVFCDGTETCAPSDPAADARGCVTHASCAAPMVCNEAAQTCTSDCASGGDADGDGVASVACGGLDCDDADADRFPGHTETCDAAGHDEDCDPTTFGARDLDADGFVDAACCNDPGGPSEHCGDDCDDARNVVHPGNSEVCDAFDNDCDTSIDEGVLVTYHVDVDGDSFGAPTGATMDACTAPTGYVLDATDCDDAHAMVHPGALGACDCAGSPPPYDHDVDGAVTTACGGDDCDDTNGAFHPGAPGTCDCAAGHTMGTETCDGRDEDCNGTIDDEPATDALCAAAAGHGTSSCSGGACAPATCDAGYYFSGVTCLAIPAARPIGPRSTARSTSRRPTFRWALPTPLDGAHVDVCADRACSTLLTSFDATGASGVPTIDLPAGPVFWRLYGLVGGTRSLAASATWEFHVGLRSAPVASTWGSVLDVNGDGLADVAVATAEFSGHVFVHYGSATAPSATPDATLGTAAVMMMFPDGGPLVASAGDVDGDGFADLVATAASTQSFTVHYGSPTGFRATSTAAVVPLSGQIGAASAGDLDADGYGDVIVGVRNDPGHAYVFRGGPSGLATTPAVSLANPYATMMDSFGAAFGSAVDLDADGFDDLVIAAGSSVGVYRGSASGIPSTPSATVSGYGASLPGSVAVAGDPDGDGYPDVVIGFYSENGSAGELESGRIRIFRGGAAGLSSSPAATIDGPGGAGERLGFTVAGAGDVDRDGYDDVFAMTYFSFASSTATLYAFRGGASGLSATPMSSVTRTEGGFGTALSGPGDVDGDGHADVLVGAPGANRAFLFRGTASGIDATPWSTWMDAPSGPEFGRSVY